MTSFRELVNIELDNLIKERCEGCKHNHPSQLKHFYCFYNWEEDKEELLKLALEIIKAKGLAHTTEPYSPAEFF